MLYQNMHNYQLLQRRGRCIFLRYCKISFITHKPLIRLLPNLSRNIPRNSVLRCADLCMHRDGVFCFEKSNQRDITADCRSLMLPNQHCILPLPL
jgi:hypothetical protein